MFPNQRPQPDPLTDTGDQDFELSEETRHRLSELLTELEQECITMLKTEIRNSRLRRKKLIDDDNSRPSV